MDNKDKLAIADEARYEALKEIITEIRTADWPEDTEVYATSVQSLFWPEINKLRQNQITDDSIALGLGKWCVARLKDSRESGEVDEDVSDAVIEREAEKLERLVFQLASSFVDNEFDEAE